MKKVCDREPTPLEQRPIGMMRIATGVVLIAVGAISSGCGSSGRDTAPDQEPVATPTVSSEARPEVDQPAVEGPKTFGEQSEPCPPSVLDNGPDDELALAEGSTCFLEEVRAGRPVIWDVVVATVEGDPIPSRYQFDGETVTITTDYSYDKFGSGEVAELRCGDVQASAWLPEGIDCVASTGDGFRSSSLPYGS